MNENPAEGSTILEESCVDEIKLEKLVKLLERENIKVEIKEDMGLKYLENESFLTTIKSKTWYFFEKLGKNSENTALVDIDFLSIRKKLGIAGFNIPVALYREEGFDLRDLFVLYVKHSK